MLVFTVFVRKVDGELGVEWDCGFNGAGGYGTSFLFFTLSFLLNTASAAALLVLPDSMSVSASMLELLWFSFRGTGCPLAPGPCRLK